MLHELLHASEHRYELAKEMAADIAAIKRLICDEGDDNAVIEKQMNKLAKATDKTAAAIEANQPK